MWGSLKFWKYHFLPLKSSSAWKCTFIYPAAVNSNHWFNHRKNSSGPSLEPSWEIHGKLTKGLGFERPLLTMKSKNILHHLLKDGFADKAVMLGLSLDFLGIFIGSITDMETWPKPPLQNGFHKQYSLPQAWGSSLHFVSYFMHLIRRQPLLYDQTGSWDSKVKVWRLKLCFLWI